MTIDPRTRLVLVLLAVVALAVTSDERVLAVVLVATIAGAVAMGQTGLVARVVRLAIPMAGLVFALSWYGAGWQPAVAAVLRLAAIMVSSVAVFATMSPEALGNALVAGGVPYQAAFVMMAAMQFVPVIARRAVAVRDAQRARGIRLDAGLASLRNYPVLALPVLYQSFKLADDLAESLESRGFARPGRTFRHAYRLGRLDWLLVVGGAAAVGLYVWRGGL